MQIIDLAPVDYGGPGPTITVARFHLSLSPALTLRNWQLRRKPDGSFKVAAPKAFSETTAYFTTEFAKAVTRAAVAAFERHSAVDRTQN